MTRVWKWTKEPSLLTHLKKYLSKGKLKDIIACKVNGIATDLYCKIDTEGAKLEPISINSKEGLEILRHSTAHLMAQAVKRLFPHVKVAIGPAIEDGFYYDFDVESPFTPEDIEKN